MLCELSENNIQYAQITANKQKNIIFLKNILTESQLSDILITSKQETNKRDTNQSYEMRNRNSQSRSQVSCQNKIRRYSPKGT